MKFGDIFPLLLVLLILYYAAMIAMDLYKAKLEKEAEKEKNTEEDIDISDEAASFQPIQIRRDEPKITVPSSNDDKKSDDGNSDESKSAGKEDTATDNESKTSKSTEAHATHDEDKSEAPHNKPEQASIDKPKSDPFDPEAYRIPDEVLAEHRKEHPETSESKESFSKPTTAPEPQSSVPKKKALRAPVMSGGFTAEELVSKVVDLSSGVTTDLQNFMYKCESA